MKRDELVWVGMLKPTPLSLTYEVELRYRRAGVPKTRVLKPKLEKRGEEEVPHLYPDGSLCLYFPKFRQWLPTMFLSESILPWTSEYLAHYEIWFATGKWLGGGVH